jgi:CDP-diacylglycerol--glycerol-3-phosphate 3-phosphatidyltransferase
MNISNYLTISRILFAFVCIALIVQGGLVSLIVSFLLFIVAAITDFLDGYYARRKGVVSDLGKLLDPIADKVLILGIFLSFLTRGVVSVWMVIVIMMREFIITGVRLFALSRGRVLEAQRFGKHKTFSQMLGINIIFIVLIAKEYNASNKVVSFFAQEGIAILMLYIVVVTAFSGIHYLWDNRKIFRSF